MSEPFIAEIKIVGFNFAMRGWALCDGQILPISQNQALFALVGTLYGGDGRTTFGLPDLRGRVPLHIDAGLPQGVKGGAETHTLSTGELPVHSHALNATTADADSGSPAGNLFAVAEEETFEPGSPDAATNAGVVGLTGGNLPHTNMQPFLTLNFQIALVGLFPSRS